MHTISASKMLGPLVRRGHHSGLFRGFFSRRINIVCYHGVWKPGSVELALFGGIDLDRLADDLRVLRKHFRFVGLDQVLREPTPESRADDRPPLAVTFDDGCDMRRSGAVDLLDEFDVPATMFVITDCIDNSALQWMHRLSCIRMLRGNERFLAAFNDLSVRIGLQPVGTGDPPAIDKKALLAACRQWPIDRRDEYGDRLWAACDMPPVGEFLEEHHPYVSWKDLEDWIGRGHDVGLHTASHPFCSLLTEADYGPELIEPARLLKERLDRRRLAFAYPFGERFEPAVEKTLGETGLFTCMLGNVGLSVRGTPPYRLERAPAERGVDMHIFGRPVWLHLQERAGIRTERET